MKVAILGAGAWGTALAVNIAPRNEVTLWARDAALAGALASGRINERYLPGIRLPGAIRIEAGGTPGLAALAAAHELVIVATPMAGLREMLVALRDTEVPVAWLCKGFEASLHGADGLLGHEIRAQVAPRLMGGALSGPSFAQEVAQGRPTALVAASAHPKVRDALVAAVHGSTVRVYVNDDLPGVEVGGAVKNVLAIAAGLCDGLDLGLNARAALITRGLTEITRLGIALGARAETFMGLSGLGDLVLTATGDLSRNRRIGFLLAQGRSLGDAVESLGHVAEGVYCARTVVARAVRLGVEMPIASAVVALLEGTLTPARAVAELMGRDPTMEGA
ncbi:MAG: NAD(P)H-dependent glycerol-3-phosphate dehydrogenase [Pseudomonadota bacterium]